MSAENTADITDVRISMTGRVAAVTGGGSGIGEAVSRHLHAAGATVVLLDRDERAARRVADELGDRAHALACDVTDRAALSAVADEAERLAGPIDVLVNCAGVVRLGPAEDLAAADWDATIGINLTGTFNACQEFGGRMIRRGDGRIVNLASQAATVALPDHVAYCASKFGVVGVTKALASEWGPRGVTVNAVSPTVVLTPLGRSAWDNPAGEELRSRIPVNRFAEPEEIAVAVAYLASRAAGMINGADLVVDGGYTIR